VADVLVDLVGELEEVLLVVVVDAGLAEIVVGLVLGLEAFVFGLDLLLAVIAVEVQHPLIVGLAELVADAEDAELEVVVACEDF
jgi:hypothetical protein